jgi:plastocyanin
MTRRSLITTATIAVAALALGACSGDDMGHDGMGGSGNGGQHSSQTEQIPTRAGQFRLDEWTITADANQLPSGSQTITAINAGNHTHELVIVRAADVASLPTKSDGSVDEDALKSAAVGEIEDVRAGASKRATFDLAPGSYVAFCNIIEDVGMGGMEHDHFDLGMHTAFVVDAG